MSDSGDQPKVENPGLPAFYRSSVGSLSIIALLDGSLSRERPHDFVRNAHPDEVEHAFREIGENPGQLTLSFTTLALQLADQLVLIDAGFGKNGPPTAGRQVASLTAAGHEPSDVGTILISHFHGDHISGLITPNDEPVYPNANIMVPRREWEFWMDGDVPDSLKGNVALCKRVFAALDDRVSTFDWGDAVLPNIKALRAEGHTPGHTMFEISSDGERMLYVADITNNPLIFARRPHWQAAFDIDADRAIQTRRSVLGSAADNLTRLFFFHAPFPAIGHIVKNEEGFEFMPEIWR